MILNEYGQIVMDCWLDLPNHYDNIILGEFQIMPNHIHCIIGVDNSKELNPVQTGLKPVCTTHNFGVSNSNPESDTVETGLKPVCTSHNSEISNFNPESDTVETGLKPVCTMHNFGVSNFNPESDTVETGLKPVCTTHNFGVSNFNPELDTVETGLKPVCTTNINSDKNIHGVFEFIRALKSFSSRRINEKRNSKGVSNWQERFHDHIIRNEAEYNRIIDYIINNPKKWDEDCFFE
ncbi:transposase [Flavobacterium sp. HJJ]|uniref:transposase n=1 Tax=Flavobacterium sp. HJJ TaxID=2783792 RepID=UPI00188A1B8F|nr:transposase [Flavobacterium sp. HJJ]MBF4472986.1 hypothetical protein [Flavobacterium sp. HJJ]